MIPSILHVVRRYGCVGGMEKYVWELTHHLVGFGLTVEVICETIHGSPDERIKVHRVQGVAQRRRWKAMYEFRDLVDQFVSKELQRRALVVHSHERSIQHHVTTFHGPPMQADKVFGGLPLFNKRVIAWEQMEKDELSGENVRLILPVSHKIKAELLHIHPTLDQNMIRVAWPGVGLDKVAPDRCLDLKSRTKYLFVGKEWKRKGLDIAVGFLEQMQGRAQIKLDVYGPANRDLPSFIKRSPIIDLKGWVDEIPWHEYAALIHPARNEPFGMVVSEARANGVPTLVSDRVGSSELGFEGLEVCQISASPKTWIEALHKLTARSTNYMPENKWSWNDLAKLHIKDVYEFAC